MLHGYLTQVFMDILRVRTETANYFTLQNTKCHNTRGSVTNLGLLLEAPPRDKCTPRLLPCVCAQIIGRHLDLGVRAIQ